MIGVKIHDLMSKRVITAQPHHTIAHVRGLMRRNGILAVPVADSNGEPVGIITSTDPVGDLKDGTPVSRRMTRRLYKVPAYNDVSIAARIMRKHRIHHVVVTHEKKLIGIISTFDLLQLVEDHRFKMKGNSVTRERVA